MVWTKQELTFCDCTETCYIKYLLLDYYVKQCFVQLAQLSLAGLLFLDHFEVALPMCASYNGILRYSPSFLHHPIVLIHLLT